MPRKFTAPAATCPFDAHNDRVRAEHKNLRARILELRPGWDPAKLEAVQRTYGRVDSTTPGLHDILEAVKVANALEQRFGA